MSISLSVSGRAVHRLMAVNGARRGLAGQRKALWSALHELQILPASSSQKHNRNHTSNRSLLGPRLALTNTSTQGQRCHLGNFLNVKLYKTNL